MSDIVRQLIILFGILTVVLTIGGLLIWLERRMLGLWQYRYGPNRVGPFGLLQVVADMIKVFTKEDWIPPFADKAVFIIGPAVISGPKPGTAAGKFYQKSVCSGSAG